MASIDLVVEVGLDVDVVYSLPPYIDSLCLCPSPHPYPCISPYSIRHASACSTACSTASSSICPSPCPTPSRRIPNARSRINSCSSSSSATSIGDPILLPTIALLNVLIEYDSKPEPESEPQNISTINIMVSKARLEELEYLEKNIESIVAQELDEYIRSENLNLESYSKSHSE